MFKTTVLAIGINPEELRNKDSLLKPSISARNPVPRRLPHPLGRSGGVYHGPWALMHISDTGLRGARSSVRYFPPDAANTAPHSCPTCVQDSQKGG
jgi:hypothetical protein